MVGVNRNVSDAALDAHGINPQCVHNDFGLGPYIL